jgi:hypothetical protein
MVPFQITVLLRPELAAKVKYKVQMIACFAGAFDGNFVFILSSDTKSISFFLVIKPFTWI